MTATPQNDFLGDAAFRKLTRSHMERIRAAVSERITHQREEYQTQLNELTADLVEQARVLREQVSSLQTQLEQIRNATKSSAGTVAVKLTALIEETPHAVLAQAPQSLVERIKAAGLSVNDLRPEGSLWFYGNRGKGLELVSALRAEGLTVGYAAHGSKATKQRAAWYTKAEG